MAQGDFDGRPLQDHRIGVTAEESIGRQLAKHLTDLGALPVALPCLRIEPPKDSDPLRRAFEAIGKFDWIVITSRNGVAAFLDSLTSSSAQSSTALPRIAAVGPSTARLLEKSGHSVSLVPRTATSDGLLEELVHRGVDGTRTLLLQGDLAAGGLQRGLEDAGARVSRVVAYRTIEGVRSKTEARQILVEPPGVSVVTLMSGSAARALHKALGEPDFAAQRYVCIGPATAGEVQACGARPARVASPHTMDGLIGAVIDELS